MTNAVPAIAVRELRKTYTDRKKSLHKTALNGVTLEVPQGAFFGLLGPNGAGKSTMINILAGLVIKSAGEASILGYDIEKDMRQARQALGVVPQELILDTFFTVREALDIHAGYYGVPKAKRRTQEIIDALGLGEKADVNSRHLSGGMRRRLLVAKALVHAPPVLILDEPTAGVDVELRTQLWHYVKELNRQGTTILLTTHYLEEAEELCDTIAVINRGNMIACDSKAALLRSMDSKEVVITPATALGGIPAGLTAWDASLDEEGRLILKYRPSRDAIQDILDAVCSLGLTIRDITTREATLEDIFIHLTRNAA